MGIFLTDLADVFRAAGLNVVEVSGWRTRGWRGGSTPDGGLRAVQGILEHHTATSAGAGGDLPSQGILVSGRAGVAGPLCNWATGRSGTIYVIAAGRANHSGAVDDQRYFNDRCLGNEIEHPGDDSPMPPEQYEAAVRATAAARAAYGMLAPRGHKEAAVPYGRKIDPRFDMDQFRSDVAIVRAGGAVPVSNPVTPAPSAPRDYLQVGDRGDAVRELQTLLSASGFDPGEIDGIFGANTKAAVIAFQRTHGLQVDGIAGVQTMGALRAAPAPSAPAGPVIIAPGVPAPAFPLPAGYYFGPKSGPVQSVSGYYSHRDDLRQWQQRMADRGWVIAADGYYGPQTDDIATRFQREKGLVVDGLIGPVTWEHAWTEPITR